MHDFYLANQILKLVLSQVKKNSLKKVKKIVIELGKITHHGEDINPENLKFNLKILSQGTLAEKAEVEIKETRGRNWKLKEIKGE